MGETIKLIWDFRGPAASKTAEHHEKHLRDFIESEAIEATLTGHTRLSESHSYAFMVVPKNQMIPIRDALKPHRGEIYEGTK